MAGKEELRRKKYRAKKAMLKRVYKKTGVAFIIVMAMFLVLAIRIMYINYSKGESYSKIVLDYQSYTSTSIPYKRGQILDCNGTVLAYSEKVYNLILDPKLVLSDSKYKEPTLNALVSCFGLERATIEQLLATKPSSQYERLLKELTADEIAEFKALLEDKKNNPYIKGVWFEESYKRKYPFSSLASDVIGFASAVNGGEIGLEKYYDDELSGIDGVSYSYVGDGLDVQKVQKEAADGYNIVTTIDYNIQNVVEKAIMELNEATPSTSTSVIVMDPDNGEVLSMASYPTFDLNNPRDLSHIYSEEELANMSDKDVLNAMYALWNNYCVSSVFEPGSTFKSLTIAAALEENAVSVDDTFACHGYEMMAGYKIGCHAIEDGGHGELTLKQSLGESCNPALMKIAERLGKSKMCQYQKIFGMGAKTGIDLPGEEVGLLISEDKMAPIDLACNSFGQNLNVTMVQIASAYCSIINGGYYYKPHMVKRIEKSTGEVVENIEPTLVKQVISNETSEIMRDFIRGVIEDGTAGSAGIAGYDIGGKTGTAQKHPREDKKWVVSFIGAVPMDDPQFVVYVVVDEPYNTSGTGNHSEDAKTIFRNIMTEILPYMNIYKQTEDENVEEPVIPAPDTTENESGAENQSGTETETATHNAAMDLEYENFVDIPDINAGGVSEYASEADTLHENQTASQAGESPSYTQAAGAS